MAKLVARPLVELKIEGLNPGTDKHFFFNN
jgi:hypothetical protein